MVLVSKYSEQNTRDGVDSMTLRHTSETRRIRISLPDFELDKQVLNKQVLNN